ncbi:UNVERIFIED_CONTAM: hypothetical protein K2H54_068280 [Gekko kuhli]
MKTCLVTPVPASSIRFGSSHNISQESSRLSELEHSQGGSAANSEHEEELLQEVPPVRQQREAHGSPSEWQVARAEREEMAPESGEKGKEPAMLLILPPEAEKPKEVSMRPPDSYPEASEPPLFAPARARWIRAINKVRLQFQEEPLKLSPKRDRAQDQNVTPPPPISGALPFNQRPPTSPEPNQDTGL